jgi:uncharacterized protein YjeT (DUF2065 family)
MDTISVLTLRLAEAIGLYLILIGLSGFVAPQRWRAMIDDMDRSPGLVMGIAFPVFAVGAAMVMVHRAMTDPLAIAVTLIGYIVLIEGALLIAAPGPLLRLGRLAMGFTRLWAIVSLILGLFFFLAGLLGRATFSV